MKPQIIMKPQILIFVDDDFQYGLEQNMYPELFSKMKAGQIEIANYAQINSRIDINSIGDLKDIYILNPYTQKYNLVEVQNDKLSMSNIKDVLTDMVTSKANVIKEALVRLGAKQTSVINNTKHLNNNDVDGKVRGGKGHVKAELHTESTKELSITAESKLVSKDPNRKALSVESTKKYIYSHGLGCEPLLVGLWERYRDCGELTGVEDYEFTFLSEVRSSLSIAASVSTPLFNAGADIKIKSNTIQEFSLTVHVNFDKVEPDQE